MVSKYVSDGWKDSCIPGQENCEYKVLRAREDMVHSGKCKTFHWFSIKNELIICIKFLGDCQARINSM